ncbi:unnamed protein product [Ectocarpus fasciculatus]
MDQGGRKSWWKGVRAGLWLTGVLAALSITANVAANPVAILGTKAPDNDQDSSAQPPDMRAATLEGASSSFVLDTEPFPAPATHKSGTAAFEAAIPPPPYEDAPTEELSPVHASSSAVIDEAAVHTTYQRTVVPAAVSSHIDDGENVYDEARLVVQTVQNVPIQLVPQDHSCGGGVDGGGNALKAGCVSIIAASLETEQSLSTTGKIDATKLAVEAESGAAVPAPATRLQAPPATQEASATTATTTPDSPTTSDTKGVSPSPTTDSTRAPTASTGLSDPTLLADGRARTCADDYGFGCTIGSTLVTEPTVCMGPCDAAQCCKDVVTNDPPPDSAVDIPSAPPPPTDQPATNGAAPEPGNTSTVTKEESDAVPQDLEVVASNTASVVAIDAATGIAGDPRAIVAEAAIAATAAAAASGDASAALHAFVESLVISGVPLRILPDGAPAGSTPQLDGARSAHLIQVVLPLAMVLLVIVHIYEARTLRKSMRDFAEEGRTLAHATDSREVARSRPATGGGGETQRLWQMFAWFLTSLGSHVATVTMVTEVWGVLARLGGRLNAGEVRVGILEFDVRAIQGKVADAVARMALQARRLASVKQSVGRMAVKQKGLVETVGFVSRTVSVLKTGLADLAGRVTGLEETSRKLDELARRHDDLESLVAEIGKKMALNRAEAAGFRGKIRAESTASRADSDAWVRSIEDELSALQRAFEERVVAGREQRPAEGGRGRGRGAEITRRAADVKKTTGVTEAATPLTISEIMV